jgi:hypothetical protein
MSHKPTRLDVITDLRRSIMASFSKNGFKDQNAKTFLRKAEANLKEIKLSKNDYSQVMFRLNKAKNPEQPVEKRREDVLMASSLV